MLLAAGLGKRLRPATLRMPKQMIPVAGRPMLEYLIQDIKGCGIEDVCLVVGHGGEQIRGHFGDGADLGVRIEYRTQEKRDGTASALLCARDFAGDGRFLVYLSDTLVPGLRSYLPAMEKDEGTSVLVSAMSAEDKSSVGNVTMDGSRVTSITEKREDSGSNLAWAGIAACGKEIFGAIEDTPPSGRGEYEITDAMNTMIGRGSAVAGHLCSGHIDFGTPSGLAEASRHILGRLGLPRADPAPGALD